MDEFWAAWIALCAENRLWMPLVNFLQGFFVGLVLGLLLWGLPLRRIRSQAHRLAMKVEREAFRISRRSPLE